MLREEAFLDTANIESSSGVTFGVTRPAKHASNPLAFPSAPSSGPNYHLLNASAAVLPSGNVALTAIGAKTGFAAIAPVYAESDASGLVFSTPSLGLVNWGGNTNNNVMYPTGVGDVSAGSSSPEQRYSIGSWFWHEDTSEWVALMRGWNTGFGGYFYTSPNPYGPWTLRSTLRTYHLTFPSVDPNTVTRRADGRWVAYYQQMTAGYPQTGIPDGYYAGRRRDLGVLLSDSTDLFGTWTDQGIVLACTHASRQYYGASAWLSGESVCVGAWIFDGTDNVPAANTFNGTINRVHKIALYASGDGIGLTLVDDDWLPATGSTADWDGGEVLTNSFPVDVGDEAHFYYAGDNATHHQDWVAQGNRRYVGLGTWDRNRLGYIEGPGEAILDAITPADSSHLRLNCSGTVDVELLDLADNPISGFALADCDTLTGDNTGDGQLVTWNGEALTPGAYKVRLVLAAGARAYYATSTDQAAPPPPGPGLILDESSSWEQDGTAITARALTGRRSTVMATAYSETGGAIWGDGDDVALFDIDGEPVDGETTITLTAGVPARIELGVTPTDPGAFTVRIGVPE